MVFALSLIWILASCDSVNHLLYVVENATDKPIKVYVPRNTSTASWQTRVLGVKGDTLIEVAPNESVLLGILQEVNFPWATKKIYQKTPGICGLKLIEKDTVKKLDCSKSSWKYEKRISALRIE